MRHLPCRFLPCLALTLAACSRGDSESSSDSTEWGSLSFEVTDAPIDPALIAEAVIEIDAIRVHCQADGEVGFVTVFDGVAPLAIDLTSLRNGVTAPIEAGFLEPGTYRQARMLVTDASLRLTNGKEYSTRTGTLDLTSQDASGYKIFFDPAVVVHPGVETRVLLDFQLLKTYSPIPANDLENARAFRFHPLVRFALLQETGELRGVVTTTDALGAAVPAAGAVVHVLDPGESDLDRAVATTLTDDTGSAAILGLPAGTFDVLATHAGKSGRQDGIVITRNAITSFAIPVE